MARTLRVHVSAPFDVYCGRLANVPFKWSGPGRAGQFGNYALGGTVAAFRPWFADKLARDPRFAAEVATLKGKRLACFCPLDRECHVDVIIEHLHAGDPVEVEDDADGATRVLRLMRQIRGKEG